MTNGGSTKSRSRRLKGLSRSSKRRKSASRQSIGLRTGHASATAPASTNPVLTEALTLIGPAQMLTKKH